MTPTDPARIPVLTMGRFAASTALPATFALHDHATDALTVDPAAAGAQAIAYAASQPVTAALMDQLPQLRLIANFGVGYDRVDVAAATARGITVTNTPDVLTDEVADFTLGLLIATVRQIPAADAFLRSGAWAEGRSFPLSPSLRGRKIGIVGMGRIGQAIARRCAALDLPVSYCARTARPHLPYRHYTDPVALAHDVSILIVVVPGGPETSALISAEVLAALGSDGILVNVARGSVVDEPALIDALESGRLLAAGLDVFADEPQVPARLIALPNVVLVPHVGSATRVTREAMGDLVWGNIRSWFETGHALTPVNRM